jgi:superfamily II DNA/RNA helicase
VGTPLLAGKLIKSERLQLANARFLILDEGDRLLDDQFVEQVDAVLAACTNPHLVSQSCLTCVHTGCMHLAGNAWLSMYLLCIPPAHKAQHSKIVTDRPKQSAQVRGLFSASLSETVEDLARTIMHNPVRVTVGEPPCNTASSCA